MPSKARPFITRSFYLMLAAGWAGAVAVMFITAVWGGLQGLLDQPVLPREVVQADDPSLAAGKRLVNATTSRLKGQEPQAPSPRPGDATFKRMLAAELLTGAEHLEHRAAKVFGLDRTPANQESSPAQDPAPQAQPQAGPSTAPAAEPSGKSAPAKTAPRTAPAPKSASRDSGQLYAVDFDCDANRFIMTVSASGPVEPMTWFVMDNPRRLIMDLHGKWVSGLPRITELSGGFISSVHVGDHPDYVRFVCFLADPQSRSKVAPTFITSETGVSVFVLNPL